MFLRFPLLTDLLTQNSGYQTSIAAQGARVVRSFYHAGVLGVQVHGSSEAVVEQYASTLSFEWLRITMTQFATPEANTLLSVCAHKGTWKLVHARSIEEACLE